MNFIEKTQRYIRHMNIVDFALLKICLASMGTILGISMPKKHKKKVAIGAGVIFALTYAPLMAKFLDHMINNADRTD
ncbi:MAG: permease of phosphate ABC transporter [Eubacteriales bacterium]|nr:permease of phosphate ABC transporter [Eubacteriales bacterium]